MMKSRLDSTQHEAQNARNLLLWLQEVFLMLAGVRAVPGSDSRVCEFRIEGEGVEKRASGAVGGFHSSLPILRLDSRLRGNDRGKAIPCTYSCGMWGQLPEQASCNLGASCASVPATGVCRGAKPLCRGFGGVPQLLFSSPKIGGLRGLTESFETASPSPCPVQRPARHDRIHGSSLCSSEGFTP
jgi:hypothetical protein